MSDASSLQARGATVRGRRSGGAFIPRGFTLIELLVTLSVAAILLGIAVPAFSSFVQNGRLSTEAQTLAYDLTLARSEAVKLDTTVEVCASNDGANCNGASWADGWIVVCPATSTCPPGLGTPPVTLQVAPALNVGNVAAEVLSGALTVDFLSAGQTDNGRLEFVFCDHRGAAFGRDVEINAIGEIASSSTPGETVSGGPLGGC